MFDTYETVPPSRLFELAATHFDAAIATSRIGGPRTSPSAMVTVLALHQAETGAGNLSSINTPSAPHEVRERAASALDTAQRAIALLRSYLADVVGRGDKPIASYTLPEATRQKLTHSRALLREATAIARGDWF